MSEATIEVRARLTADQVGFQKGMEQAAQATQQLANASAKLQRSMVALGAVSAIATGAIIAFGVKSFNAAARVDELDVAMNAVGKSTGLGYQALAETADAVKGMGIEMEIAQKSALTFAQNNLKLSYASELARAAQDLAVISGQNSTDTFNRLTYAVITGRSEVLKTVGIQKSAGQMYESYAKSINKSAKELTFQEKQQAVATGALAEAAKVAGTYEAAMKTPGKVLRSFARIINEIQVAIGKSLLTGFGPLIYSAYEMVKSFSKALEKTRTFQTVIKATGMVLEKLTAPFTRLFEKIKEFVDSFALGEFADDMVKAQTGMSAVKTTVKDLASNIEFLLPPIAALLAGFSAFAGARVFAMVPGLGSVLGMLNPLKVGLVVLALTSTQVREALGRLGAVIKPLLTPFAGLAKIFTGSLGYATALVAKGIDGITKVISTAIGFVQRYSNIFKVIGAVILTLLVVLAAAKIALLAQALVLSIASAAASKFAAVQGFLNSVMALNPIALVVIALIGLVTAIVIAYKSSEAFAETFRNAFNSVATVVGQVLGFIFRLFGNLLLGYGELMSTNTAFGHLVANVFQFVYQSITFTITFILKVFAFFIDGFVRLMETNQTFARIVQDVFNVVARIISGAVNFILTVLATFIKIIAAVIWGVSQMKDVVVSVVKGVISAFQLFGEKVGIIFEVITGAISRFTNFVRDKISAFIEMLIRKAKQLPDFLGGNEIEEALIRFNATVEGADKTVKEFDETMSRSKLDKITADTKKATDGFSAFGLAVNNTMSKSLNFTSGVSGALSDVANTLLKVGAAAVKFTAQDLGKGFGDTLLAGAKTASKGVNFLIDQIEKIKMAQVGAPLVDLVSKGAIKAGNFLISLAGGIESFTSGDTFKRLGDNFTSMIEGLKSGLGFGDVAAEEAKKYAGATGSDASNKAAEKIQADADKMKSIREALRSGLEGIQNVINDLRDAAAEFAKSLKETIMGFAGLKSVELPDGFIPKAQSLIENMRMRLDKSAKFATQIAQLSALGLDTGALKDIIDSGPIKGAQLAASILGGNAVENISQINSLQKAIAFTGAAVGAFGADAIFSGDIAKAQAGYDAIAGSPMTMTPTGDSIYIQEGAFKVMVDLTGSNTTEEQIDLINKAIEQQFAYLAKELASK